MELTTPITRPTTGRTFYVAISILGFVALLQLGAVGFVFMTRFHATPPPIIGSTNIPVELPRPTPVPMPTPVEKLDTSDNPGRDAIPATAAAAPAATAFPKPTPIASTPPPSPESRLTEMIEQARLIRDRGDTNTALTRFREAQVISPDNPLINSEIATTYEKMGMPDKALEQWRRIFDLGETAGIYYAAADAKLKAAEAMAKQKVAETAGAATGKDAAGFQPNATLGLGDVTKTDIDGTRRFSIKIPIKSRPGAKVEVRDVVIQVFFYDLLPDASVVQTNANVSSKWSTLPADWGDGDLEVLDVEYAQPADDAKEKNHSERKFFGYVIRVYYKSDLQAYSADPQKLLKQYPPPVSLQQEESR